MCCLRCCSQLQHLETLEGNAEGFGEEKWQPDHGASPVPIARATSCEFFATHHHLIRLPYNRLPHKNWSRKAQIPQASRRSRRIHSHRLRVHLACACAFSTTAAAVVQHEHRAAGLHRQRCHRQWCHRHRRPNPTFSLEKLRHW